MGRLRRSNDVVLAKIETTYNTDPVPVAGTNAVLVQNAVIAPEGLRMVNRPVIRGFLGDVQDIFAGQLASLAMDVEVKGSGTAGTVPELGVLFRGCALGETIVGGTSVTYKPVSTNHESITLYYYEGGLKLHKLTGCRGTCAIKMAAGGITLASFKFTGHVANPTDASQPNPTFNAQRPIPLIGLSVTFNAISIVPQTLDFDFGNKVILPPNMNGADGYGEIQIADRSVQGSVKMDAELASFIDVDALLSAGTPYTITTGTIGGTAGNKLVIASTATQAYFTNRALADTNGIRDRTMAFKIADTPTTDSELSLAFT